MRLKLMVSFDNSLMMERATVPACPRSIRGRWKTISASSFTSSCNKRAVALESEAAPVAPGCGAGQSSETAEARLPRPSKTVSRPSPFTSAFRNAAKISPSTACSVEAFALPSTSGSNSLIGCMTSWRVRALSPLASKASNNSSYLGASMAPTVMATAPTALPAACPGTALTPQTPCSKRRPDLKDSFKALPTLLTSSTLSSPSPS
mmetsp:Transcript_15007/g.35506  ORF Transcript_15007/g.35506 Transcript_15007/m.35506 type:complete len:206 (+) Transcript_15007:908-1525(+)